MKTCVRCVLPETFPGIRFDERGVCNVCLSQHAETGGPDRASQLRAEFETIADRIRGTRDYDCVLAYSGGKDSTYTLWLLREHYRLRVLAVTFDNGFMSPQSFVNIRKMAEVLNADSLVVKPRLDLLTRIFRGVLKGDLFPPKAMERASRICNACIVLVKNIVLRVALENDVPIVAFGWSPGQAPISGALFKMNARLLKQTHHARSMPLLSLVGEELRPYMLNESHFEETRDFPYSVNPMAFHPYTEHDVRQRASSLGWQTPVDTDGNSSNCLLNALANRQHLNEYGFHPYAFEVAGLVRAGALTREEGLASLTNLGSEAVASEVARRLGIEDA